MARRQQRFTRPADDEAFDQPLKSLDARGWLGDVRGKRILCLGAGGGKAGPLFATAGAIVTVVDLSPEMLRLDREVAAARRLALTTVAASMDDLSALPDASFDLVSQPVSTCYVADIVAVYREVARVIVAGGIYVSQHKQPTSLQADVQPGPRGLYELVEPYYRSGPLPNVSGSLHRESGTHEYLHRWEELLGGLCQAGFVIDNVAEPLHADPSAAPGSFKHRSHFTAPYVAIRARRTEQPATPRVSALWTP